MQKEKNKNNNVEPSLLAARLAAYEFDQAGIAWPMSRKLADEQGWSREQAVRVLAEYKRFIQLAVLADHTAVPSDAVDQAWHLHLCQTRDYWEHFCPEVLGQPLHHQPSKGGEAEDVHYLLAYRQTLISYENLFGEPPPRDIWPEPSERFSGRYRRFDRRRYWLLPRVNLPSPRHLLTSLLALLGLGGCARIVDSSAPGALPGPDFLSLYLHIGLYALLLLCMVRWLTGMASGPARMAGKTLHPYQLAWLAGGRRRVIHTVLTRLYSEGRLLVLGNKALAAPGQTQPLMPMEYAVLAAAGAGQGALRSTRLARAELERLEAGLQDANLAPSRERQHLLAWLNTLVLAAVLGLGLVRLWFGVVHGRPVAFLVLLLLLYTLIGLLFLCNPPTRNDHGQRELRQWRLGLKRGQLDPEMSALVLGVAVSGVAALGVSSELRRYMAGNTSGGGSGGCGSGCGGGGCGGGCGG